MHAPPIDSNYVSGSAKKIRVYRARGIDLRKNFYDAWKESCVRNGDCSQLMVTSYVCILQYLIRASLYHLARYVMTSMPWQLGMWRMQEASNCACLEILRDEIFSSFGPKMKIMWNILARWLNYEINCLFRLYFSCIARAFIILLQCIVQICTSY